MTRTRRLLAATGVALAALVALAPAASAHVTVEPTQGQNGEDAVLTFQVPNEKDDAGTTTVEINFPTDHPIPFVSVRPQTGWTYQIEKKHLDKPVSAEGEEVTEVGPPLEHLQAEVARSRPPGADGLLAGERAQQGPAEAGEVVHPGGDLRPARRVADHPASGGFRAHARPSTITRSDPASGRLGSLSTRRT